MNTLIARFEQNAEAYLKGQQDYQTTFANHRDLRIEMTQVGTRDGEVAYASRCFVADHVLAEINSHAALPGNITLPEFWSICKSHDWFYAYSDDHRVYTAGNTAELWINAIAKANGQTYADLLKAWRDHVAQPSQHAMPTIPSPEPAYRYILTATGGSSAKYGLCEVCKGNVTAVFHQVEERRFPGGWTREGCHDLFGHEKCLMALRRKETTNG